MRIAYAVHGYGRGHATRALAILPRLAEKHHLMVLAGGDAYAAIRGDFPNVVRIPTLGFAYRPKTGRRSHYLTLKRNLPAVIDLLWHGPVFKMISDALTDFAPSVVISDAEGWSHRVAKHLGIPRINVDHIGIMESCHVPVEWRDRLEAVLDRWAYRALMCTPDRAIISSFFDAPPRRPGIMVVGTMAREVVRNATPSEGEHILVYLNQGLHQLVPTILEALEGIGRPVHIYGTERRGRQGRLHFLPPSDLPFVEDLASCHAVISTAGNQLMGEAIVLGKPVLVMPERCVEQRLNAASVERLGIGMRVSPDQFNIEFINEFLSRRAEFVTALKAHARDGLEPALAAINRFLSELAPREYAASPAATSPAIEQGDASPATPATGRMGSVHP